MPTAKHREEARHKRLGPEDYERIQESLDSLDWNITDEQAEAVLREFGTNGKEIANQFIDRLLKERQEAIDTLSSRDAEIREVLEGLVVSVIDSENCWCPDPFSAGEELHDAHCLAARRLWKRVQG